MRRPRVVLTDIEGTITPIAFVRDTLFPYARARLPRFVETQAARPEVAAALAEVGRLAPGRPPTDALLQWMEQDAKVTPLKALQGMIWEQGYRDGSLLGALYPDVAPALRTWHAAGIQLAVYSSGSIEAQRLLLGHSLAGDLIGLFETFFDTTAGGKRDPASYCSITRGAPAGWLFLSDVPAELVAAAAAGLEVCQVVRAEDGTVADPAFTNAADFDAVARQWDA